MSEQGGGGCRPKRSAPCSHTATSTGKAGTGCWQGCLRGSEIRGSDQERDQGRDAIHDLELERRLGAALGTGETLLVSTVGSKTLSLPRRAGFARGFGNNGHQRSRRELGEAGGAGRGRRELGVAGAGRRRRWVRQ